MAVTLYRQVGKGKARRYQKVNLGRGRRPTNLAGPYFLRYSLADGTRPWEPVGDDLDAAIDAQKRKQAYFEALDANVPVIQEAARAAELFPSGARSTNQSVRPTKLSRSRLLSRNSFLFARHRVRHPGVAA
jgi:hypothetical protein